MKYQRGTYRNALRSRTLIRDAFLQLMQENDVMKIKVKDVIELANVSKGTFYAHYNNIFDVLEDIETEYLTLMFKVFHDQTSPIDLENLLPLFLGGLEEIEKQKDIFHILLCSTYSERFINKVKKYFLDYMLENYSQDCSFKSQEYIQGFFTFVVGGAITLVCDWIDAKEQVPSDVCAHFLNDCIINGIKSIKTN